MTIKRKLIGSFIISFMILVVMFMGFVLPNFHKQMIDDVKHDIISNMKMIDEKANYFIRAEFEDKDLYSFLENIGNEEDINKVIEHSIFSESDVWELPLGSLVIVINDKQLILHENKHMSIEAIANNLDASYLRNVIKTKGFDIKYIDGVKYHIFPFINKESNLIYYRKIQTDLLLNKAYNKIKSIVNVGISFIFAFSLFLLFFIHKIIILPINKLNQVTKEIVNTGNTNLKVDINCTDEIGETANSFNEMVDTIRRTQSGLEEKVKERTEKLEAAKLEAIAASTAKSEFLANMSHEIRTPINAVIGLNDLLSRTSLTFKQNDYVEKISMAANNLLKIINDILDFSKVEAGKMIIETIDFKIDDIIEDISGIVGVKAADQEIEFVIKVDNDIPKSLKGDPKRLTQVLLNLINNAIKFTSEGEVLLDISLVEDIGDEVKLNFLIKDTGIGMNETVIESLFDQFTQADASTTRNYGGTGLGLAIAQNILNIMDSEINVVSELGVGSKFNFELVLPKASNQTRASFFKDYSFNNYNLLLVDDNEDQLLTFSEYLKPFFKSIEKVSNGYAALDVLSDTEIDLMIIDYKMNPINGIQVIDKIFDDENINIPRKIIFTTAYGKELLDEQLDNYPIDWLLMKPVQQKKLLESIEKVFSNKHNTSNITKINLKPIQYKGNILIAEDNEINQMVLLENLKNNGFNVDIASNGQEAYEKAISKRYDIILMDLQMPIYSGYEASRLIRKESKEVPIIALSADVFSGVIDQVNKAGMNDYLSKPINFDKLYELISTYTNKNIKVEKDEEMDLSVKELKSKLSSFEVKTGVDRIGGSYDKYLMTVIRFKEMLNDMIQNLKTYNDKELKGKLHQFAGASGNLGFTIGYKKASSIMEALTHDNEITEERLDNFIDILKVAVNEIKEIEEDVFLKVSQSEVISLSDVLNDLLNKLADYDVEASSNLMSAKGIFIDNGFEHEFNRIKEYVNDYLYEKAMSEIEVLLEKIRKI